MPEIASIKVNNISHDIVDTQARERIGELDKLNTTNKNSLIDAINEVKETAENGNIPDVPVVAEMDTEALIFPYRSPNLWDGSYNIGSFKPLTGEIDTTNTTNYWTEVELEPNTEYTVYGLNWMVKYPADMSYSVANYKKLTAVNGTYLPVTFNSGNTFKYCRFGVAPHPSDATNVKYFGNQPCFIVKGSIPSEPIGEKVKYFMPEDIKPHSFYRSVQSKLKDLYNPFKPTAVATAGDSITQGVHSANKPLIVNCYAKLLGDYILEMFHNKIHRIPLISEHVIHYDSGRSVNLETSSVLNQGDTYIQMDFYGSYIGVSSYNGEKKDVNVSIYIDGELYATHNFYQTDTTEWVDENLSMDYHTIRVEADGQIALGSFNIKKYVTFANRGISGHKSLNLRILFSEERIFDNDDIIFCMIGTNDRINGNFSLYDFNLRQVFKHGLEKMGKEVILMSATPSVRETYSDDILNVDGDPMTEKYYPNKMKDIVAWVNIISGMENEEIISFHNWLLDYMDTENRFRRIAGEEELTLDYFFNDGLHPTEECHRLMFNYLIKQLGFAV